MKQKLYITKTDLEKILEIVKENGLGEKAFLLIQDNDSGIGYTTTMEYIAEIHSRIATIQFVIADTENW
jgi:hypothetical protein